jgi:two-component system, LytTR family, sensor kinase
MDNGDPVLERSGSGVRPARSFISPLASTAARVADVLVDVGSSHSAYLLDRRAASVPGKAVRNAHTSASAGEHSPNACLYVPVGRNDCSGGLTPWNSIGAREFVASISNEGILWKWLVYWVIFGARQTFLYYQHYMASELRLERMERSFSEARLNALRMQLDPHFLFNALNTISSQVERDPRLARTMIEHLGDLLRLSLDARDRPEIPLAEELAFLDHYVAIQKIRFAENLRIEVQVTPDVKYALVPCLIVQPLVENAIRHGISRRASGGRVTVTAKRGQKQVEIRVTDDGVGLPPGWTIDTSSGTGLSVTRERILGLHPDGDCSFSVRPRTGGGTEVEISLPLRFAGEPVNAATN